MLWIVLQAAAITLIITEGSIFNRLRSSGPALWRQLWSCPLCLGTWVGMVLYVLHSPPIPHYAYWVQVLGFGCLSGVLAYTVSAIWEVLDRFSGPEAEAEQPKVVFGPPQAPSYPAEPAPGVQKIMLELREKAAKARVPHVGQ